MPGMNSGLDPSDPIVVAAFRSALLHQAIAALVIIGVLVLAWAAARDWSPSEARTARTTPADDPAEPAWQVPVTGTCRSAYRVTAWKRHSSIPRRNQGEARIMTAVISDNPVTGLRRIWAELTGNCQLECVHCYADPGPGGSHGRMTARDWMSVIDDARALGASMVQFIGGEPTMHPQFPDILRHAIGAGAETAVYTNLVHVTDEVWELLTAPGASLAFSYYSSDAAGHNAVTGRNSHAVTRRNAAKAVSLGIPIRAGVIETGAGLAAQACEDLRSLGITRITTDRIRAVGRAGMTASPSCAGDAGKASPQSARTATCGRAFSPAG